MSKDKISDYSATANSNTDIGGINIDEGCAPSGINDAIRTLMKQLKDWQSGSQDVYIHPAGSASVPSITATGDTNTGLFFPAADTVGIATGGSERLRLDSSGRLGIGSISTPASYQNIIGYFQNGRSGWAYVVDDSANTHLVHNLIFNGTNNVRAGTGYSSRFSIIDSDGSFRWYQAGTGSSGATASLSTNMTLDASGNLGIGTTSPSSQLQIFPSTANVFTEGLRVNRQGQTGQYTIINYSAGIGRFVAVDSLFNSPSLGFFTSSDGSTQTERARIDSSGNLLVGVTSYSDGSMFYKSANTALSSWRGTTSAASGVFGAFSDIGGTGTVRAYFRADGGLANYSANNVNLSDENLKKDISLAGNYLAKICAIPVKNFRYKDQSESEDITLGVIAQDVLAVAPELVSQDGFGTSEENKHSYLSVYQTDLQYALMKALQELKAEFDAYKATHP